MTKKRLKDHGKLKEAGNYAKELLIKKKLILPDDKSALERIRKAGKLTLPGVPDYLPYPWTIHATRRVLYDIAREWQFDNKSDEVRQDNVSEFFKFVVKRMRETEDGIGSKIAETVKKKEYDFKILHQRDAAKGIRKFLVDSFAVAVVAKSKDDVASYLEWFDKWADGLLKEWGANARKIK